MKVRLKLSNVKMNAQLKVSFNSMKVRLKQGRPNKRGYVRMFQFHEGPIKTKVFCLLE